MAEAAAKKKPSGWLNLLVDYGPILVFFLVYKLYSPADHEDAIGEVLAVIRGTGAFIVAAIVALIISKWRLGRISPMLWLSTALIVFFGGLTITPSDGASPATSQLRLASQPSCAHKPHHSTVSQRSFCGVPAAQGVRSAGPGAGPAPEPDRATQHQCRIRPRRCARTTRLDARCWQARPRAYASARGTRPPPPPPDREISRNVGPASQPSR